MKIFDHLVVGPLGCNCYIVGDEATSEAIVIDPGDDADGIAASLVERGLTVTAIVATHAHFDHVLAAQRIRELTGAPFYLNAADNSLLDWVPESVRMFLGTEGAEQPDVDRDAPEGEILRAGEVSLEVLHTPGHSPGSISLVAHDEAVFSGDTLFAGSVGRTDLPGGDTDAMVGAITEKLFALGDLPVYPGHGPATSLERERVTNPFVGSAGGLWTPE